MEEMLMNIMDKLEEGLEFIGQASAVLAATVGQLHPFLKAVFELSYELFSNPERQEAHYLNKQLSKVNQKLDEIQDETNQIAREQQRISLNKQYFDCEAQILSQYEKFQDIINAKPDYKMKTMENFISHYENTDSDINLNTLYNAVTGNNISGNPMLKTVAYTGQWNRWAVEDFCARLKKLFLKGIIAAMCYGILKKRVVRDEMVKKWQDRMEDIENRMKAVVDDIIENFAQRAEDDIIKQLAEKPGSVDLDFTGSILDTLVKKYYWVRWSVKVFNDKKRIFCFNCLVGKKYHGSEGGANYFEVMTKNNIKVMISFSVQPKLIDKDLIKQQIEGQKLKRNMMDVAQVLSRSLPNYQVHAVSYYKKVVESNNFQNDCFYDGKHQKAYLYIHAV
uniref:Rapunzel 5 n=1 Tax=Hucho hucho TaxID=62062 RepID=A0A4W5Q6Y8_9TELE